MSIRRESNNFYPQEPFFWLCCNFKSRRKDGFEYHYLKKRRIFFLDKKFGFLKLLEKGEAKLYQYTTRLFIEFSAAAEVIHYLIEIKCELCDKK